MIEKEFTTAEVREIANSYIKNYRGYNLKNIKDAVWSDYNNMPGPFRRPKFADSVIRRITRVKKKS